MVSYVNYLFNYYSSGVVTSSFDISSAHFDNYQSSSITRAVFEGIYVILLLFYTIIELQEIKQNVIAERLRLQTDETFKKCASLFMFFKGLKNHFSSFWNCLDLFSLMLSYIGMGLWISLADNKVIRLSQIKYSSVLIDDVLDVVFSNALYIQISSINVLIIFLRLLKYLGKFERIRLLHQTLQRANGEIFYFFIVLGGTFFSFVIFAHVAFGGIQAEFSKLGLSFTSCLIIVFSNMETVNSLLNINFTMAAVFIVLFTLMINFILVNMFIAIINNAYAAEIAEMNKLAKAKKIEEKKH